MAPIEMRNLTTFPMERLCFDLKLEVLEQLDARKVIELGKVNQGFQSMISSRPSIVFGHHVDTIEFGFEELKIKKLNSESPGVSLDVIRHFAFIKNIRSCDLLIVDNGFNEDYVTFLKQLEAVNSLYLYDCPPQHLELLSHLSIKVKRFAELPGFIQKAPSIKDLVEHFIATQLNECKMVSFGCKDDDDFQFYHNAFIKTHIRYVVIVCDNADIILPAIQRIVSHGIPSSDPAGVLTVWDNFMDDMKTTIVGFLTRYPGMRKISRKNRRPFIVLANELWKESRDVDFPMKSLCFRRNINAARDGIYMLSASKIDAESCIIFFASFYIKPDEMIDH